MIEINKIKFTLILPPLGIMFYLCLTFLLLNEAKTSIDEMDRAVYGFSFMVLIFTSLLGWLLTLPFHDFIFNQDPYWIVFIISTVNFITLGLLLDAGGILLEKRNRKLNDQFDELKQAFQETKKN